MIIFLDFDRTLFDTEKFYNALEREIITEEKKVSRNNFSDFLYSDTIPFLKKYSNHRLVLVTFGNKIIQGHKVQATGLSGMFFEEIYIESGPKAVAMKAFQENHQEKALFVDDSLSELYATEDQAPSIEVIRMRRSTAKNSGEEDGSFTEVSNLNELEPFIIPSI